MAQSLMGYVKRFTLRNKNKLKESALVYIRKGPRGVRVGQETGLTDPEPSPDCKEK